MGSSTSTSEAAGTVYLFVFISFCFLWSKHLDTVISLMQWEIKLQTTNIC